MKATRKLITCTCLAGLPLLLGFAGRSTTAPTPQRRDLAAIKAEQAALTPAQVLGSLRRGNERFASGKTKPRVETEETNTGDTLYGRYGRNTRFSDVQDTQYAVSAAVETAVAYHVKAEMPYAH